jgi:hypothetical protein
MKDTSTPRICNCKCHYKKAIPIYENNKLEKFVATISKKDLIRRRICRLNGCCSCGES